MKNSKENHILLLLCTLFFSGSGIEAFSYDYSATTKCLVEPHTPQYGGGIIVNPEFNGGLNGWNVVGQGVMEERISKEGNKFLVVHSRTHPLDSFSQKLHLEKEMLYVFSAWVQISRGTETIAGVFKTPGGSLIRVGSVMAKSGCWSMLKGGISANFSGTVELYFESRNTNVEIWVDSISLQPFTKAQWRSHQSESIEKVRKRNLRFQATDANGTIVPGARISIKQTKSRFPFGCAMAKNILTSTTYQNWFSSRFTATTFANEMKWYSTETKPGQVNYTIPDAMVAFAEAHKIPIRGHNIFWDNPTQQPQWVKQLTSSQELKQAAAKRIDSVVSKYRNKVIAWDVVNENLHFSYYEDRLGANATSSFFTRAHQLDSKVPLFINEFNTIEDRWDQSANPDKYLNKIKEIQRFPGNKGITVGIGLQSHFNYGQPNIPYMRASIDKLAATGLPIWLTEVDVDKGPNQAKYLKQILEEGFSHPAVKGIIVWSGPQIDGCDRMCLTDYNYKNTPAGDVVDNLIKKWKSGTLIATADNNGYFEASLFHGDYSVTVTHPITNSSATLDFKVAKRVPQETLHVAIPV